MKASPFEIRWMGTGRKARHPSSPDYPDGVDVDFTAEGSPGCMVTLPYPAKEVENWIVECSVCGITVAITAAGRPDDPRQVRIPCKVEGSA